MSDESYPLGAGYGCGTMRVDHTKPNDGAAPRTPHLVKATVTITRAELWMLLGLHDKMIAEGYVNERFTQFVHGIFSQSFGIKSHISSSGFIIIESDANRA